MRIVWLLALTASLVACGGDANVRTPTELQSLKSVVAARSQWAMELPSSGYDKTYPRLGMAARAGVLYNVTPVGNVIAQESSAGRVRWNREIGGRISSTPALNEALVFVGTTDGELVALEQIDGKVRWRARLSSEIVAAVAANSDYVVARSVDGRVYGLHAADGSQIWQMQRPVPVLTVYGEGTPVISDDTVLIGFANGRLAALNIDDGTTQWEVTVASPRGRTDLERMVDVDATPLVVDGIVYAGAHQGRIMAVTLDDGRVLWSRDISTLRDMAVVADALYLVDDDSVVHALDRKRGVDLWQQEWLRYRNLTAPVVQAGMLVLADMEGYVHWLAQDNGQMLGRYRVGTSAILAAPLVDQDRIYIRDASGHVEALQLQRKGHS